MQKGVEEEMTTESLFAKKEGKNRRADWSGDGLINPWGSEKSKKVRHWARKLGSSGEASVLNFTVKGVGKGLEEQRRRVAEKMFDGGLFEAD